ALLINPYDVDGFAETLFQALVMPADEQERRMRRLRQHVADQNIYRWAGQLLSSGAKLIGSDPHVRLDMPMPNHPISPHLQASPTENIYGSKE
ncbi:MAG: trehalose-6-phosphate synthase, partial [Planctomycetales bacterium]|nr:trehalose-6-phosphate synthase [Planctomycetales bacterium]